ncbi:helix-turn-helix domain-containing protein [Tessaracoccus terricola]
MTAIETLRAVHHPTRRRIIEFLDLRGPSRVTTLARELGAQVGSISHHLRMLEKSGVVERVPELATDGRTSWWRNRDTRISWSVDDFADRPAERLEAKAIEKLNVEHQLRKLTAWKRESESTPAEWRRAAFSSDSTAVATPAELADLQERLLATTREWLVGIDRTDGQERRPVFVFVHGFPTRP